MGCRPNLCVPQPQSQGPYLAQESRQWRRAALRQRETSLLEARLSRKGHGTNLPSLGSHFLLRSLRDPSSRPVRWKGPNPTPHPGPQPRAAGLVGPLDPPSRRREGGTGGSAGPSTNSGPKQAVRPPAGSTPRLLGAPPGARAAGTHSLQRGWRRRRRRRVAAAAEVGDTAQARRAALGRPAPPSSAPVLIHGAPEAALPLPSRARAPPAAPARPRPPSPPPPALPAPRTPAAGGMREPRPGLVGSLARARVPVAQFSGHFRVCPILLLSLLGGRASEAQTLCPPSK